MQQAGFRGAGANEVFADDELIEKAFGGAAEKLVVQALSSRKVDPEEIETLRKLLDELEEKSP